MVLKKELAYQEMNEKQVGEGDGANVSLKGYLEEVRRKVVSYKDALLGINDVMGGRESNEENWVLKPKEDEEDEFVEDG